MREQHFVNGLSNKALQAFRGEYKGPSFFISFKRARWPINSTNTGGAIFFMLQTYERRSGKMKSIYPAHDFAALDAVNLCTFCSAESYDVFGI